MSDFNGKRVVILGAARQGLALARYLARHGAQVVLNDRRPAAELGSVIETLKGLDVEQRFGDHPLDLLDGADLLSISGGIPLDNPLVAEAIRRGIRLTNDSQVFMEIAPCRTLGITGSAGKTTTTTLVGRMAQTCVQSKTGNIRHAWIGGNIGDPLINYVDEMQPDDLAILEISSFQLDQMTISPDIAAVLNITPNHLDRHGTMEAYAAAKARILDFQTAQGIAVLNRDDAGSWSLIDKVHGRLLSFGANLLPPGADGTYLRDGLLRLRDGSRDVAMMEQGQIPLRGMHNVMNVLAACAIGHAAGFPVEMMANVATAFRGVPHRLELVREWNGVQWYNDSIATAPERTAAAVLSFEEPIVLMLGGRDKNLPWDDLAALIRERVDGVVIFGEAAGKIAGALGTPQPGSRPFDVIKCSGMKEAVQSAAKIAKSGSAVLLSPGATSFDEFKDFEERGERFKQWVLELS
jgi:UDP-N-acetylmuramoylalanine--D-glutamate ligase